MRWSDPKKQMQLQEQPKKMVVEYCRDMMALLVCQRVVRQTNVGRPISPTYVTPHAVFTAENTKKAKTEAHRLVPYR
jgi:hypothetical protein